MPLLCVQSSLGLNDRVRYSGALATAPCMIKIGAATNTSGCGRMFTPPGGDSELAAPGSPPPKPTPIGQYDAEFVFASDGKYDPKLKQIPFTCAPRLPASS
jgi:hypothetical protein